MKSKRSMFTLSLFAALVITLLGGLIACSDDQNSGQQFFANSQDPAGNSGNQPQPSPTPTPNPGESCTAVYNSDGWILYEDPAKFSLEQSFVVWGVVENMALDSTDCPFSLPALLQAIPIDFGQDYQQPTQPLNGFAVATMGFVFTGESDVTSPNDLTFDVSTDPLQIGSECTMNNDKIGLFMPFFSPTMNVYKFLTQWTITLTATSSLSEDCNLSSCGTELSSCATPQ